MKPITLLKLEGFVVLIATTIAYHHQKVSWWLFAALFLIPDIFMLGYVANKKCGALIYNLGHTYLITIPLAIAGWHYGQPTLLAVGIVWSAHIGFDRLLGYGLKYPDDFKSTHLNTK